MDAIMDDPGVQLASAEEACRVGALLPGKAGTLQYMQSSTHGFYPFLPEESLRDEVQYHGYRQYHCSELLLCDLLSTLHNDLHNHTKAC